MSTSSPTRGPEGPGARAWILGGPVFAMLSLVAVVNFGSSAETRLRKRFHELQADGRLELWQPSPYAEELQRDLKQAFSQVGEHFESGYRAPQSVQAVKGAQDTAEDREAARVWSENVRPYVEEMERILARPTIREALERGDPLSTETPKLIESWRRLDPVLIAARFAAFDDEDHERSVELLHLALDLKQSYNDCTILAGFVSSITADVAQAILWILEHTDADPAFYAESLGSRFPSSYVPSHQVALLRNEIARMRAEASRLARKRKGGRSVREVLGEDGGDWESHFHYLAEWLDIHLGDFSIVELSGPEFYERYGERWIPSDEVKLPEDLNARVIVHKSAHRFVAANALFRVQLALLVHQHRNGAFPERLEDLEGFDALPLDPHTGTSFPYERLEAGARLGPARLGHADEATLLEAR